MNSDAFCNLYACIGEDTFEPRWKTTVCRFENKLSIPVGALRGEFTLKYTLHSVRFDTKNVISEMLVFCQISYKKVGKLKMHIKYLKISKF